MSEEETFFCALTWYFFLHTWLYCAWLCAKRNWRIHCQIICDFLLYRHKSHSQSLHDPAVTHAYSLHGDSPLRLLLEWMVVRFMGFGLSIERLFLFGVMSSLVQFSRAPLLSAEMDSARHPSALMPHWSRWLPAGFLFDPWRPSCENGPRQ